MRNRKAFSVGEMMIVLLILSVILAASTPIITRRSRATAEGVWHAASNNADAYFNAGANNGIIIGGTGFINSNYAKLLLNTTNDIPHLLFSKNNSNLGKLRVSTEQIELGNTETTASGSATVAIGKTVNASANNSVAIGETVTSSGISSIGIGNTISASGSAAVAIGKDVNATAADSIAIGNTSTVSGQNSVAIGKNSTASGENNISIGNGATTSEADSTTATNAIAIGRLAKANYSYSVAIGPKAETTAEHQINIGTYYNAADGITAINIGGKDGINATVITLGGTNAVASGSNWTTSDKRRKNIIREYKSGLDDILKIKTYEFTYKDDLNKNKKVGVIAQELQKIFPNSVRKDDKGYLMVRKEDMFFAVINAIKELYAKYVSLEKENMELRQKVEDLSKRIEKLEQAK